MNFTVRRGGGGKGGNHGPVWAIDFCLPLRGTSLSGGMRIIGGSDRRILSPSAFELHCQERCRDLGGMVWRGSDCVCVRFLFGEVMVWCLHFGEVGK